MKWLVKGQKLVKLRTKTFKEKKLTSFLKGSKMFWKSEKVLVEKTQG